MQVTIARQLGLEPTTVGNFFMNARRRSMDKWRDDDIKNQTHLIQNHQQERDGQDEDRIHSLSQTQCLTSNNNHTLSTSLTHDSYVHLHPTALSPLEAFNDEVDMELELESQDFDLDENLGDSTNHRSEML